VEEEPTRPRILSDDIDGLLSSRPDTRLSCRDVELFSIRGRRQGFGIVIVFFDVFREQAHKDNVWSGPTVASLSKTCIRRSTSNAERCELQSGRGIFAVCRSRQIDLMIICCFGQTQRILTDQRHWPIACDRLLLPLKLNLEPVAIMVQNGSCSQDNVFSCRLGRCRCVA
jgi:hypothetical protein